MLPLDVLPGLGDEVQLVHLGPVVTLIESVTDSQDILSIVSNIFNAIFDEPLVYNGTVTYTWSANIICEGGHSERREDTP